MKLDFAGQAGPLKRVGVWFYLPALVVLVGVAAVAHRRGLDVGLFTRDPSTLASFPPYYGFVSMLGGLAFGGAGAVSLFTAALIPRSDRETRLFFFFSGLLSALLMADDLFMFHDNLFPKHLGVPEKVVYGAYLLAILALLVRFRARILAGAFACLAIALGFFGASIACDLFLENLHLPMYYLFEDGLKFVGITGWLAYYWNEASSALRPNHAP